MPAQLKLEWPDGQLANALRSLPWSVCLQICQSTTIGIAESREVPKPPTWCLRIDSGLKSGSQTARRKGRGLPATSFSPSVMMNAPDNAIPRPIHAAFHSQSFLRHMSALGVDRSAVGPGTKSKEIAAVMTPGATIDTIMRTGTVTVSS